MSDRYIVDTPENIELSYDVAGIGSRFLAAIVDTLLVLLLQGALLAVMVGLLSRADSGSGAQSVLLAVWGTLSFLFLWGYYIVFELIWNGQSPGKRAVGLRVVRTGGRPITFVASAIRNLVRLIDFLPGLYGVGVVTMFIDGQARRLGDLAAGTLVVKEGRALTLDALATPAAPPLALAGDAAAITLPNIDRLAPDDYDLLQEYLARRADLGRDSRARLAAQLAAALKARLGLPEGGNPEIFLEYVASQYRLYTQGSRATQ
jgi:uncharacterized RDD family membrane protein YckC